MGQLSDDGHWWWDGGRWTPAHLSADKLWHWDGTDWQPAWRRTPSQPGQVPSPPRRRAFGSSTPPAEEGSLVLDSARFGAGQLPDHSAGLPDKPSVELAFVAVGEGWVARRVVQWHVMPFNEVQSVAVVLPLPQQGQDPLVMVGQRPPFPDLAIRDFFGHVLRIDTGQMTSRASKEILGQLPMSARVTPVALMFLEEGTLPGEWGVRLAALQMR